ncbi:nicotinate-nucleotide adenylyltransferase [Chryseolinea lacunae]|uniref:Nicotinate-nucleotide adenylyltransferase n=1 Tax=Chryseolinea lacunae TaxID=2801331 RepID=A0ABS1KNJ6_9BACT|nr:nicotinate-nucleotide adenylyltransferase [Chryseolinea lacunae]MBL0741024.1 nicotinate-nucleotide adenylyltransferase [Chryseolinea lacunae]
MKTSTIIRTNLVIGVLMMTSNVYLLAQETLPEITVTEARYKYLNAVNPEDAAQPVNMLEHYAAAYDLKGAEFYEDEYDNYIVSFFIPNGKILAFYDKDGKLLRTAERFKNTAVPLQISKAVAKKFPNWTISRDVYVVTYHANSGSANKQIYKLMLENSGKRMRVKLNSEAEFL